MNIDWILDVELQKIKSECVRENEINMRHTIIMRNKDIANQSIDIQF